MNDQAHSLRLKLSNKQKHRAKTISIVSGKGGVGKSNFALNFSLELIKNNKKVILFDLDVGMGNINILLGLQPKYTIVEMLNDYIPIHRVIEKGPYHLSYISGGTGLNHIFMMDQKKKDYFYEQYKKILFEYDYIIFDMGAGANDDSLYFVLASDECIVITTPEPTSITDAYSMIKFIAMKDQNMPIFVVMNRSFSLGKGQESLHQFQKVIEKFISIRIIKMGVLPDDQAVRQAVMQQIPYVILKEKSAVSRSMKMLTHNYIQNNHGHIKQNQFSFIDRLKRFLREM